jgi:recombination protein RecA
MIKACQQHHFIDKGRNGVAAFIDAEHALDPQWAKDAGVDIDNMLVAQPDYGEQAFQIVEMMVRSRQVDLIVIDSVAALVPKAELDGEVGDSNIGLQARMISQGLRKLCGIVAKSKCTIVFINQLREKIGVMFGNPETTPGGRALKFYSSIRVEVRKGEPVKDKDEVIGFQTKIKVVKNKIAPPFQSTIVKIGFGNPKLPVYGVDDVGSVVDAAIHMKILSQAGSTVKHGDTFIGSGADHAARVFRTNDKLADTFKTIKQAVYDNIHIHTAPVETPENEDTEEFDEEDNDQILDGSSDAS